MPEDELKKMLEQVYPNTSVYNFDGKEVPCITLSDRRFDEIMTKIQGKPVSVNTNLNILQDGLGHVFVEVKLDFSYGDIHEKFLLYANESLKFFECLANTTMLALSPPSQTEVSKDKIFMVQLPKPERARTALDMINKGLSSSSTPPPPRKLSFSEKLKRNLGM